MSNRVNPTNLLFLEGGAPLVLPPFRSTLEFMKNNIHTYFFLNLEKLMSPTPTSERVYSKHSVCWKWQWLHIKQSREDSINKLNKDSSPNFHKQWQLIILGHVNKLVSLCMFFFLFFFFIMCKIK